MGFLDGFLNKMNFSTTDEYDGDYDDMDMTEENEEEEEETAASAAEEKKADQETPKTESAPASSTATFRKKSAKNTSGKVVSMNGVMKQSEVEQKSDADMQNEKEAVAEEATDSIEEVAQTDSVAITAQMCSPAGQYPVMGESVVTVDELADYFNQSGYEYPSEELAKGGADTIETFCQIYCEEAEAEDIRAEVAFTQAMKETGFLQFGGDVCIGQFNFAGIGTTGGGVPGNSYPDVRTGVRAQIQHLKAYATDEPLNQTCVDNRYEYVKKASAPYVQWLGQKENPEGAGWATGENYGYDIAGMLQHLLLKEQG